MFSEIVCIFPDTRPKDEMLFPLVQLFAEAVYIVPVENDLSAPDELPPLARELLAHGLLRLHCPAPLGADRMRFLSLINELRQRPGEYAALSLQREDTPESKHAIINALRRGQDVERDRDRQRKEQLWQVRLVLKLGDIIEQQEEEISENLRRIARRENDLLKNLREQDDPPIAHQELPALEHIASSRTQLRLQAWRTLAALGSEPPVSGVFVTADRDAFDLLTEEHGLAPQPDCVLLLPAFMVGGDLLAQRNRFSEAAAGLTAELCKHPAGWAAKEWNILLDEYYPADMHGRCRLSLHSLPKIVLQELFSADLSGGGTAIGLLESVLPTL